jgi:hypothetical protein
VGGQSDHQVTDIVDLMAHKKVRKDEATGRNLRLVCACGNASYELLFDGGIECAECRAPVDDAVYWWRPEVIPTAVGLRPEGQPPPVTTCGAADLVEVRAKRHASEPDVTWIAHGKDDGSVRTYWREGANEPDAGQVAWLLRRLTVAVKMLTGVDIKS